MKNIKDIVKTSLVSGKKLLAGANLVALTIAMTPNSVDAQSFANKEQKQAIRADKKDLTTDITNAVENLLPNKIDCFTKGSNVCRFESQYPSKSEGDSAISQIKQNLSELGCRVSLDENGCEGVDAKICQMIWWECKKGIQVRSVMYMRTK